MVVLPTDHRSQFTVKEYFALDAASERRNEYYAGEVIAKTGINRHHALITGNVSASLNGQLTNRENCVTLASAMRVRVSDTIYFYPDVLAACDDLYTDESQLILTNPALIVEVTSESTALYDRTTKLEAYKRMPSVQEILIIDQHRVHVDQFTRVADGWLVREFSGLEETLALESLGCTLAVSEIYAKVDFQI